MGWFWNKGAFKNRRRQARNRGHFLPVLESLEQRICLTDTLFSRIYHDLTGNGSSADDLPMAGWTFQIRESFIDYFPDTDEQGHPIQGQRTYQQTSIVTTDAQGYLYHTLTEFSDPTPISPQTGAGLGFEALPVFAFHDMTETPEYRGYYVGGSYDTYMLAENLLQVSLVRIDASPADLLFARSQGYRYERAVYLPVMVSGTFFEDWNGDGIHQQREPGFANQFVSTGYRYDILGNTHYAADDVYTDPSGHFTFEMPPTPGFRYFNKEMGWDFPWEWTPTAGHQPVSFTSGQQIEGFDLGIFKPYTASGFVYEDKDGSGTVNSADQGYSGNVIYTYNGETTELPVPTNLSVYSFRVDTPPVAANPPVQPTVRLAGDQEGRFVAGPNNTLIPASDYQLSLERTIQRADRLPGLAYFYLVTVEGRKYRDTNANGEYDAGIDVFLPNARISLDLNGDGTEDMTTETDGQGRYRFEGVRPGNHRVRLILAPGETPSPPTAPDFVSVQVRSGQSQINVDLGTIQGRDLTVLEAFREDNKTVHFEYEASQITLPFEAQLYRSADNTWDTGDEALGGISVIDPTVAGTTGTGIVRFSEDYVHNVDKPYVLVVIDPRNKVTEIVEDNNALIVEHRINTAPYQLIGEFEFDPLLDRQVSTTTTVQIGFQPLPGEAFIPLIYVSGTFSYSSNVFETNGTVSTSVLRQAETLFTGTWKYDYQQHKTTSISTSLAAPRLGIAGQAFEFHTLTLVNPSGGSALDSTIDIQGLIYLPIYLSQEGDLKRVEILIDQNNKLRYGANGREFTGTLKFPDVEFKLYGLSFEVGDLEIEYQGGVLDRLRVRGEVTIKRLVSGASAVGTFKDGNYLEFNRNGYELVGEITVANVVLKRNLWELRELKIFFNKQEENYGGVAEVLTPLTPLGVTIIAGIGFRFDEIDLITLGADHMHVLAFGPGWFLQKVQATIANIATTDPDLLELRGTFGFTYGPEVRARNRYFGDGQIVTASLLRIDVTGAVNFKEASFTGDFKSVHEDFLKGTGVFKVNFEDKITTFNGEVSFLKDLLKGTMTSTVDSVKNGMTGSLSGEFKLPDEVPDDLKEYVPFLVRPLLGKTLASGKGHFVFSNDGLNTNDFVMAYATVDIPHLGQRFSVGLKFGLDGSLTFQHNLVEIMSEEPQQGARLEQRVAPRIITTTGPKAQYRISADTEKLLLTTEWENDIASVNVEIVAPDGTVYSASTLNPELITVVEELSNATHRTFAILAPMTGLWTIQIPEANDLGNVSFQAYRFAPPPTIQFTNNSRNSQSITLNYLAEDSDSNALVSLYYDTNNSGLDGVMFASGLAEQDEPGSYTWDTSGLPEGTYYVYALIEDGRNGLIYTYYDTPLTLNQQPPSISGSSLPMYVREQPAIPVVPNVVVTASESSLAGGLLTVSISDFAIGKKQVRPDELGVTSLNTLGTVAGPQFVNGQRQFTILLKANVSVAQIQSALRNLTFSTSPKGLKSPTRTLTLQITDALGTVGNAYTQQIRLLKKAPKPSRARSLR